MKSLPWLAFPTSCQGSKGPLGSPVWRANTPDVCGPHLPLSYCPGHQELGTLRPRLDVHTHHALPEQEATGYASPNLQLDGLRHLRQAVRGEQTMGQKSQIPICLSATCPLPRPVGSPNTHLTSWRRRGWGGLGSRHHRNRLHTVPGHLWEKVGGQTSTHLLGVSTWHRFPAPTSTLTCTPVGLWACRPWRPRGLRTEFRGLRTGMGQHYGSTFTHF